MPTETSYSASNLAILLRNNIFRLHSLPKFNISGRDLVFTSNFALEVASCLSIDLRFSSAFHPQIDGPIKRINLIKKIDFHTIPGILDDNLEIILSFHHSGNLTTFCDRLASSAAKTMA